MSRILMIDPEDLVLGALQASPVLAGHDIVPAAGDVDALRRLRFSAFDVVITSPATTVEEDLHLLDEVWRIRPGVRAIVLAGRASRDEVVAALAARVFAVFSRPFDPNDIAAMVSGAVASAPGHDGILLLSVVPDWVAVRIDCSMLTAERVLRFISELRSELPGTEREALLLAYREVLLNAISDGAGRAAGRLMDVAAIRTARAVVLYVKHPGFGFDAPGALSSASPESYRLLVARAVVDEMIYNEHADEVILIKHAG